MELHAGMLKRADNGQTTFTPCPAQSNTPELRAKINGLVFAVSQKPEGVDGAVALYPFEGVLDNLPGPKISANRLLLYGGRYRFGELLKTEVARALMSIRVDASLDELRKVLSASKQRNLLLEDLFTTFAKASWRVTRQPNVELVPPPDLKPVTIAWTGQGHEKKPLVQIVRKPAGGLFAAVLCDLGLERMVFDASLSTVSRRFRDWAFPEKSYGHPAISHLLRVVAEASDVRKDLRLEAHGV